MSRTTGGAKKTNAEEGRTLGTVLRMSRHNKGCTISQVADDTNLSQGYISKLELDQIPNPSDASLFRLAVFYALDFIQLKRLPRSKPSEANADEKMSRTSPDAANMAGQTNEQAMRPPALVLDNEDVQTAKASVITSLSVPSLFEKPHDDKALDNVPQKLQAAYNDLALSYYKIGFHSCMLARYQEGLEAYQAAEAIYSRLNAIPQVHRVRYRLARTYQSLAKSGDVQAASAIVYLARGIEYLSRIPSDVPPSLETAITESVAAYVALGAAARAVTARLYRDMRREMLRESGTGYGQGVKERHDLFAGLSRVFRAEADILYEGQEAYIRDQMRLIETDASRHADSAEAAYVELALLLHLRAINLREAQLDEDTARDMPSALDFTHILEMFRLAIKYLRNILRSASELPYATRSSYQNLLANLHKELGSTYMRLSERSRGAEEATPREQNYYKFALWQVQAAAALCDPQDRYILGDEPISELMDIVRSDREQDAAYIAINDLVEQHLKIADFKTLTYPLDIACPEFE